MGNKTFFEKTAIVTGAGRGIGFEISRRLAEEGARIILNDLEAAAAEEAAASIQAEGGIAIPFAGDSSSLAVIGGLLAEAVNRFGGLDIAIANAGITLFGEFLQYPLVSFEAVLRVNLTGTFFLAQAAARQMILQGRGGALLFLSSVTGHQAHKQLAAYGMTKAALEMLARNLVIELSPYRINVNTIAPGATLTERTRDDQGYERAWSAITPLGRPATTKDIADAALFLVSDAAKHITGQNLVIDGGWTSVSPSPF